ncbi:hypothetical protein GCM10022261_11840 [Brevibacterium daeguense]|uniref:PepSY domain-containing protein n=1 Tax=Brevibacterium daeguense TaxID=909936 RepID=A0ABP8EI74_9MICO|nr:hypothetical protein [Brevibacterium daeguense]
MTQAAAATAGLVAPTVAWPVQISREQALSWVDRKLSGARDIRAELYHSPMLGVVFESRRGVEPVERVHVIVDLVGGRAYAAEPWNRVAFEPLGTAGQSATIAAPARTLTDEQGEAAARRLVQSILLRTRRLGGPGRVQRVGPLLCFGKPNWWITGSNRGRQMEIIMDAVTGKHYALSA